MKMNTNSILFMCVVFLGIVSSAVSFRCYVCNGCPYRLNTTYDSYMIQNGCSTCLLTTQGEVTDRAKSDRRCLTKRSEQYFETIGINLRDGCSNISQIPAVTKIWHICFCSKELCNSSLNFHVKPHMWIWLLEIAYLLFQYG